MRGYSPVLAKYKKAETKGKDDTLTKSHVKAAPTKPHYPSRMVGTSAPPKAVYLNAPLKLVVESTFKSPAGKKPTSDKKSHAKPIAHSLPKENKTLDTGIVHLGESNYFESIGFHTLGGRSDGRAKTNQDAFYIDTEMEADQGVALFGVFDGHGFHGHRVSNFLISNIKDIFELKNTDHGYVDYQSTFVDLCHSLNKMLRKSMYIDAKLSGSTGIMVLATKKSLVCSNVGDSRAMLLRKVPGGQLEPIPMSEDQTPADPHEKQRILSHGGRVHPCRSKLHT